MGKNILTFILIATLALFLASIGFLLNVKTQTTQNSLKDSHFAKFEFLSTNGNSSCSQNFASSIPSMDDNQRLQGSCCSPMGLHRYHEQVEGLKKYQEIPEIPTDPYDIEAGLAKQLLSFYDLQLTPEEQKVYDFAMENSNEQGPCCCKCWRWTVFGGLGKLLINNYGFTGEQLTEVWNLSDGCGGEGDHVGHT